MPDGNASILLAEAHVLERVRAEGGCKASFFGVFDSANVLDTVRGGDHRGFDEMARSHVLVACDRRLLAPIDEESPDADRRGLYRANFVAKLSRRKVFLLAVVEGDASAKAAALDGCARDAALLGECHPHCRCEVVVVLTDDLTDGVGESLESLRRLSAVCRVYVMTKWLQAGRDERRLVLGRHVWPVCVARLLAVRALAEASVSTGEPAAMMGWRTFAWGTVTQSAALPVWEIDYLHTLRDLLIPSSDVSPDGVPKDWGSAESGMSAAASPPQLPRMTWQQGPDELRAAGEVATDEACLRTITHATCGNVAAAVFQDSPVRDSLRGRLQAVWSGVASIDGLVRLRHIRDGRLWKHHPVAAHVREQRSRWRHWHQAAESLQACRARHGSALEELTLARSRFLPIGWRFIIAAMILPFVLQFLVGVLLPLRSDNPGDGSSLFSSPSKPSGSIAYLVDRSSSMAGVRLDRMKADLATAITALPEGASFTVVAFNEALEEMPQAGGQFIPATRNSREAAISWLHGLKAEGATSAVSGIRELVALHPGTLVFLTDGQFSSAERLEISRMLADKVFLGNTRIDTIMLYPVGEELAMADIAKATGGQFRRVGFDPLSPLGFNRVLLVVACATVAGVVLGVVLPWLIERRAGIWGTEQLVNRLGALLDDYCRFASQTADALFEADALQGERRANAMWTYQSSVAARALAQVEACLTAPSLLSDRSVVEPGRLEGGDPLAAEDWRDIHAALDEPLPAPMPGALQHDVVAEVAASHASHLRSVWRRLATDLDPAARGHLPIAKIAERFNEAVGQCLMEASVRLFLPRGVESDRAIGGGKPFSSLFGNLAARMCDDPHRPYLSARVFAPEGFMPARDPVWVAVDWLETVGDIDSAAREYLRRHSEIRVVSNVAVKDVGIRALGLVHEEIELSLVTRKDGAVEFVPAGQYGHT